ncbi:MAG: hypothetical protein FJ104_03850, partial [Deltaproteobacteria bacterium]|nr:hypothetical protein [Deltaproteobacteria bacterium]
AGPDVAVPPDAAPDAPPPDAGPPPFLCSDAGGYQGLLDCAALSPRITYDPVARRLRVEQNGSFDLGGTDFGAAVLYPNARFEALVTTLSGSQYGYWGSGPLDPIVDAGGVSFDLAGAPSGAVEVRLTVNRARDAFGRPIAGQVVATLGPPATDAGAADGGAADGGVGDGGTAAPWATTLCEGRVAFAPALALQCEDAGTVTYDAPSGVLTYVAPYPGPAPDVLIFRYSSGGPGYEDWFFPAPATAVGARYTYDLGALAEATSISVQVLDATGQCGEALEGGATYTLLPGAADGGAPGDGGQADAGPADGAADGAVVAQFWSSSCTYDKFFSPLALD